jgi:hypothetical protein
VRKMREEREREKQKREGKIKQDGKFVECFH